MATVPQIRLSAEGPVVSRLALGMWRLADARLTKQEIRALIAQAADSGLTTIDHADVYGGHTCQRLFGEALAGETALRQKLQIVTKCGIKPGPPRVAEQRVKYYDTGRAHLLTSVEQSLKDLGVERVDLLLIHRSDPMMNADAVAEAFVELRKAGKVAHFGVSNFTTSQFELLASRLPFALVSNQLEFSVLQTAPLYDGTFDQCQRLRVSPMAWSPVAGGRLLTEGDERAQRVRRALEEVGRELGGANVEQAALAWILAHPGKIVPIIGTTKRERVAESAAASGLTLTRDQWFFILEASAGRPVP